MAQDKVKAARYKTKIDGKIATLGSTIVRTREAYQSPTGLVNKSVVSYLAIVSPEEIRHILSAGPEIGLSNQSDPQPYTALVSASADIKSTDRYVLQVQPNRVWTVTEVDVYPIADVIVFNKVRAVLERGSE